MSPANGYKCLHESKLNSNKVELIAIGTSKLNQRIGDRIAGTLVVTTGPLPELSPTFAPTPGTSVLLLSRDGGEDLPKWCSVTILGGIVLLAAAIPFVDGILVATGFVSLALVMEIVIFRLNAARDTVALCLDRNGLEWRDALTLLGRRAWTEITSLHTEQTEGAPLLLSLRGPNSQELDTIPAQFHPDDWEMFLREYARHAPHVPFVNQVVHPYVSGD